jgi:pimeloyl-ACP methyl ester carboxylesterase
VAESGVPAPIRRRSPSARRYWRWCGRGWGQENPAVQPIFASWHIPDGNTEQWRWLKELQRIFTSPENAARLMIALGNIDITRLLPQVATPTLALQSRDDAAVPFAAGRELAASIPGARFMPLSSRNHLLLQQEAAWLPFLEQVHSSLNAEADTLRRRVAR